MPIYEYECKECGKYFEFFLRSSGEKIACPSCGGEQLAKLFSSFAYSSTGSDSSTGSGCSTCTAKTCSPCK